MSKVTKNERISTLEKQLSVMQTQISSLIKCAHNHTERLIALEPKNPFHGKAYKPKPKLKQIEREVEPTGSDLCKAMLKRGDKIVTCAFSDISDADAIAGDAYDAITKYREDRTNGFESAGDIYMCAVPVNSMGEPLTASEVGL